MPVYQRILVVSTTATEAELKRVKGSLGRDPLVLTAPTAEGRRVVEALQVPAQPDVLLAPVKFPQVDRGHRLDELVRTHAMSDRFRDVVVVTDSASSVLLLRVLAPDQLATGGGVTTVGLARGDRPVDVARATIVGLVLGAVVAVASQVDWILLLPVAVALVGLGLRLVPTQRHLGRELLLVAAIAVASSFAAVAGSARFPGGA